jgi:hypothetical protein
MGAVPWAARHAADEMPASAGSVGADYPQLAARHGAT